MRRLAIVATVACAVCGPAIPAAPQVKDYTPPEVRRLTAKTLRVWPAPEATQGAAAGAGHFYAIGNTVIAKYEIGSGRRVGEWTGPRHGLIRHMNSCLADRGRIWCANSNYSLTPMGSSSEVFDAVTLAHVDSHSLGMMDEGSLTWFDRYSPPDRFSASPRASRLLFFLSVKFHSLPVVSLTRLRHRD